MYLKAIVFSFDILNTNLKFLITLEQNSLEPAHMKSSKCVYIQLSIYCFVSMCRIHCHILILWHLIFEICH